MPEEEHIRTDDWIVYRDGCTIRLHSKKARKSYHKRYKSEHAAVCAVGRMKHDHRMIGSIAGKLLAAEMAGKSIDAAFIVTAEQVLTVCWDQMTEKARIKVENEIIDSAKKGIDDQKAVELIKRLNSELAGD